MTSGPASLPQATGGTVGLLYIPDDYAVRTPGLAHAWRRHVTANAEVRDQAYMTALFSEHFAGAALSVVERGRVPEDLVEPAGTVVLLFADPIGMDAGWLERAIRTKWPAKRLLALNGRRRLFRLDQRAFRALRIRRLLAQLRVTEFALVLLMALLTPLLLLWDFARGRR